jgi:hypothetical protein
MAIDWLREAYERAEKLSLKNQDILVKQILKTIEKIEEEEERDVLFKDPRFSKFLEKFVNEEHKEHLAGKTRKGGFGRD